MIHGRICISSRVVYNTEKRLDVSLFVIVADCRYMSQIESVQIVKSQSPSRTNLLDSQSVKVDIFLHVTPHGCRTVCDQQYTVRDHLV